MAGLGQTRGDKRLSEGITRSKFRGADTIVTIETGMRAQTQNTKMSGRRTFNNNRSRVRKNRRSSKPRVSNNRRINKVGSPDTGRDISANEEMVREQFGAR